MIHLHSGVVVLPGYMIPYIGCRSGRSGPGHGPFDERPCVLEIDKDHALSLSKTQG
jgi:hypothetical protein